MTRTARLAAASALFLLAGLGGPGPAGAEPATTSASGASSAPVTFRDLRHDWGGHTRVLSIGRGRIATEQVGDGCCHPIVDVTLQLGDLRGTAGRASMRAEVLSVAVHDPSAFSSRRPAPAVGDVRRITIRGNVLHERLTGQIYCDPTSTQPWVCGA